MKDNEDVAKGWIQKAESDIDTTFSVRRLKRPDLKIGLITQVVSRRLIVFLVHLSGLQLLA